MKARKAWWRRGRTPGWRGVAGYVLTRLGFKAIRISKRLQWCPRCDYPIHRGACAPDEPRICSGCGGDTRYAGCGCCASCDRWPCVCPYVRSAGNASTTLGPMRRA